MNWKILGLIFFSMALIVVVIWIFHSIDYGDILIFSRDAKLVEVTKVDELFGTETTEIQRTDGFWLGLLPSVDNVSIKTLGAVAPLAGITVFLGIVSLFINSKKKKILNKNRRQY